MIDKLQETVKAENWHGRLFTSRWKDKELSQDASFAWMKDWSSAPTYTVTGMIELYEQLLPTKVYTTQKTRTTQGDVSCRLCDKEEETILHILSGYMFYTCSIKVFGPTQCCSEDIILREV